MPVPRDASQDPAAKAAAEAFHEVTIEIWTLFAVAIVATVLRTYGRIRTVGAKGLTADDYLVWIGVVFYAAQSALGWNIGYSAQGLANNAMTNEERARLSPRDPEFTARVIGSKIHVAGWTVYSTLMWALKLSMLAFYVRLTDGLGRGYRLRIRTGIALVVISFVASVFTIFLSCRPLHRYWQINPNPGNVCQAAVSRPIVVVCFAGNVITDIYLIMIPLPMLWKSTLRTAKKVASSFVLGAGVFVLACATVKSIMVLLDDSKGAELAGIWGIREAFTAVIVTNLPMLFSLARSSLKPLLGSVFGSSGKESRESERNIRTIGGGNSSGTGDRLPITDRWAWNTTLNQSEEHIMGSLGSQGFKAVVGPSEERHDTEGIMVSNQVEITSEYRAPDSPTDASQVHYIGQAW